MQLEQEFSDLLNHYSSIIIYSLPSSSRQKLARSAKNLGILRFLVKYALFTFTRLKGAIKVM